MADDHPSDELTSREPTVEDLRELCRALNDRGAKYVVVGGFALRAADEILVDVMRSAGGIDDVEAAADVVIHQVDGVSIPFASPRLLWRMTIVAHREKDAADLRRRPSTTAASARLAPWRRRRAGCRAQEGHHPSRPEAR